MAGVAAAECAFDASQPRLEALAAPVMSDKRTDENNNLCPEQFDHFSHHGSWTDNRYLHSCWCVMVDNSSASTQ